MFTFIKHSPQQINKTKTCISTRNSKMARMAFSGLALTFAIGLLTNITPAKADVKNGKYLFEAAGCGSCHGQNGDPTKLSGGYEIKTDFGTFVTPNISPDMKFGIGKWSKADFYAAMKEGVSPKGHNYYPSFPYSSYAGMSRKDIFDIFAYIKTLPAIAVSSIKHKLSFPYNIRHGVGLWKIAAALPKDFTPSSGKGTDYNRGKYLVEHVAHCAECHTPRSSLFQTLDQNRRFEGADLFNGEFAPSLKAAKLKRKGFEKFLKSMTEGVTFKGKPMKSDGMLKVVKNMKQLTADDHKAIFTYLAETNVPKDTLKVTPVVLNDEPVIASTDNVLSNSIEHFFARYCNDCHGSAGKEAARKDFTWTSLDTLAKDASLITPGNPEKSDIYLSIVDGSMPKQGVRPTPEELKTVYNWIKDLKQREEKAKLIEVGDSGDEEEVKKETPKEPRKFITDEEIEKAILNDLVNLSEFDRHDTRYISLTHLYNTAPASASDEQLVVNLNYYRLAIAKLINSLSYAPKLHKPVVVDGTNSTVLRINISELNWDDHIWGAIEHAYPYAVYGVKGSALDQIQNITRTKAAILKGDWFAFNTSRGKLYNKILRLPDTLGELEKQIGVNANRNIDKGDVIRAAFTAGHSGVSDHNRLIERHDLPTGGYYWKSYDFAGSDGERSLLQHPFGPIGVHNLPDHAVPFVHDGGEVFFSLPNGLQAYYLADGKDKFLPAGPTDVVRDHTRPPGLGIEVVNAASCMSCHENGIIFKRDELREFADKSSSFTVNQMKFLKELYPGKEVLRKYYKEDQDRFTAALLKLGIGRTLEDGRYENISVISERTKESRELIGYLADQHQDVMTHQRVASEFGLTIAQFNSRVEAIPAKYSDALREALRVRDLLKNGQKLQRNQFDQLFPLLVGGLTGRDSAYPTFVSKHKTADHYQPVVLTATDRKKGKANRLGLVVKVPKNEFYFGETLKFTVSTTKTCELNVVYKQADGSIVVLPPKMQGEAVLGNPILRAGEVRTLPVSKNVKLRFAPPAGSEELFVQCRTGGLGKYKIDDKKIANIKQQYEGKGYEATRGLRIEISKHADTERRVHDATTIKFFVKAR